jgi:uncharacterized UPF0146 family protein
LETYRRIEGLVDFIAVGYTNAAEIGVGCFPDVAYALQGEGLKIFATDIKPFKYDGIRVFVDDVTGPDISLYRCVDLIYSMRPPPELVPYMMRLAEMVSADLIIKPLSADYVEGLSLMRCGDIVFFIWSGHFRRY